MRCINIFLKKKSNTPFPKKIKIKRNNQKQQNSTSNYKIHIPTYLFIKPKDVLSE